MNINQKTAFILALAADVGKTLHHLVAVQQPERKNGPQKSLWPVSLLGQSRFVVLVCELVIELGFERRH